MNASAVASMRLATRIGAAPPDIGPDIGLDVGPVEVLPLERDGRGSGGQESPAIGPEPSEQRDWSYW